jgi:hypothetical protein
VFLTFCENLENGPFLMPRAFVQSKIREPAATSQQRQSSRDASHAPAKLFARWRVLVMLAAGRPESPSASQNVNCEILLHWI